MNKTLSKNQERTLALKIEALINNDDYEMTLADRIIQLYIPARRGIRNYGLNIIMIGEQLGYNMSDRMERYTLQSQVSNCKKNLVKDGYPFGALKVGRLVNYGWATEKEWEEIEYEVTKQLMGNVKSKRNYLDDNSQLAIEADKLIKSCNHQLKLFHSVA